MLQTSLSKQWFVLVLSRRSEWKIREWCTNRLYELVKKRNFVEWKLYYFTGVTNKLFIINGKVCTILSTHINGSLQSF